MNETQVLHRAGGFELFWRTMWARAYPRMVAALLRERSWMFFETVLPLGAVAGYVFVYRAIGAPEEYAGFAVFGGAMTAFWLNVLWGMGSQLYWDKEAGNLELYIMSPGPMMAILFGMSMGGMILTLSRAIVILVGGSLLFGVSYQVGSVWLLALTFFVTMAALYGMGMLFASIFLATGREAWHLSNLLQEPVYLVSGFYFPVRAMGFWVAAAASFIPLTLGMDAMRQLMFSGDPTLGFLSVSVEIGILAALAAIFTTLAHFALAKLEEVGRREGRLTERRR